MVGWADPSVTQMTYALLAEENEWDILHSPSSGSQAGYFWSLILPDFAQRKQTAIYQSYSDDAIKS